ncbi:phospholipid carrier-dependent glycosyltransferase [Qipengyuania sp. MTN3-11]|uniref:phospholipid carrier-dependent glycosyltransferase n=1 Tax=Qipengyuania sp. MTN3-11 TaxID=3056557 RepID=UPI0036F3A09F
MTQPPPQPRDPMAWSAGLCALFATLAWVRLTIPGAPYFDEVHYLPAARQLLALGDYVNREHPLLGKEFIALGIALFGDGPLGWRIMPWVAGTCALYAAMRALWFATLSRFATLAYGVLVATGFHLFVHSRIAMLDVFFVAFLALAYWQCAAAMREPETGRWRLALAGAALGLAMGAKWNAVPLAMLPGLAFVVLRWRAGRRRLLLSRRGAPVPGITLVEAALWLGVVPLAVYAATFAPAWHFASMAIGSNEGAANLIALHEQILGLQSSVIQAHPYQSTWPQWVLNSRAIWYLYEVADGAQRGILLVGNPLTMLLGVPALLWCAQRAISARDRAAGAVVLLYAISLGFWIVADKPIQFYYHYFLPSMFLLAALALALDALWRSGRRRLAVLPLAGSVVLFAFYYPILTAAPLDGPMSFLRWTWLEGWK